MTKTSCWRFGPGTGNDEAVFGQEIWFRYCSRYAEPKLEGEAGERSLAEMGGALKAIPRNSGRPSFIAS